MQAYKRIYILQYVFCVQLAHGAASRLICTAYVHIHTHCMHSSTHVHRTLHACTCEIFNAVSITVSCTVLLMYSTPEDTHWSVCAMLLYTLPSSVCGLLPSSALLCPSTHPKSIIYIIFRRCPVCADFTSGKSPASAGSEVHALDAVYGACIHE